MLVLTRKLNQAVTVGHDVEVTVIEIRGDQVRLGITAPRSLSVHRQEVWEQVQRENKAAAASENPPDLPGV